MKIIIDYGDEIPSEKLVEVMTARKEWMEERLLPLKYELEESEGILLLHIDGSYECKQTPYQMVMKIQDRIDLFSM